MPAAIHIDESDWASRSRLKCPTEHRQTDWHGTQDAFHCRSCGRTYETFVDGKTGQLVERDDVELERARRPA